MKWLSLIFIMMLSAPCFGADELTSIAEACEKSDKWKFCADYKETKKNVEKKATRVIKSLGLESPLIITGILVHQKVQIRLNKNQKITITPNLAVYTLEF